MEQRLTVLRLGTAPSPRFDRVLSEALRDVPAQMLPSWDGDLTDRRLLFAVSLDESGVAPDYYRLLAHLRTHPGCLEGSVGGILVDGPTALYTKSLARELALAASLAGCTFPGHPMVEAIDRLQNFQVQARNAGCDLTGAYQLAAAGLARRVLDFAPPRSRRPRLLALHTSSRATSNTLDLWSLMRPTLETSCAVTEIGLRTGTLVDCAGCPYTTCLHFGEQGGCFYGGAMVEEVYPALLDADAVLLLCPNYNDALPANLTAAVNRLTALYRAAPFYDKAVYALVVSGYSGGDIVAAQAADAMTLNKGFWLPARFCRLETANDAGAALRLPGVQARMEDFAHQIVRQLTE